MKSRVLTNICAILFGVGLTLLDSQANDTSAEQDYQVAKRVIFGDRASRPDNNFSDGIQALTRASNAGHVPATSMLGACYFAGRGVQRNPEKARDLLSRAASAGDAIAQWSLGSDYARGGIVPKDITIAEELLKKSAAQGVGYAKLNLALMYFIEKVGNESKADEARNLLRDLATNGVNAPNYQGIFFGTNEEAEKTLVKREAAKDLGFVYAGGIRTQKDMKEAGGWLRTAAEMGDEEAMYNLFMISSNYPQIVSRNEGSNWLQRSAKAGFSQAVKTQQQLLRAVSDPTPDIAAAREIIERAEPQPRNENPFYTVGKLIREGNQSKKIDWEAVLDKGFELGLQLIDVVNQQRQENQRWKPGVERQFFYNPQTNGLIMTDRPVDILVGSPFTQTRPRR